MKNMKFKAFTLAEVLITLAIIGIVAALTIPTLIQSYKEKVTITKVKKMYSTLSNAYALYRIENESTGFIPKNEDGAKQVAEIFKPYLRIAKDCGTTGKDCIDADGIKTFKRGSLDKSNNYNNNPNDYKMNLNDGSSLILRGGEETASFDFEIIYDSDNGNNKLHVANDVFEFDEYNGKLIPCGLQNENYKTCPTDGSGWYCTAWIINFGNMDYLHCPEKLDGETNISCK